MKPVFIIGCARSGTSILGELIASHPQVKYIFEASHIWELGGMGENESHRLTDLHATEPVKNQIREWFETQAGDTNLLVEKNPRNSLRIPYVREIFPDAKFIHIVRDGRDAACSMVPGCGGVEWNHLKPPSWQEYYKNYSGAIRCAHVWKQTVEIASSDLSNVPHIQIRYEDLVNSPSLTAEKIFDFLGMGLHPATLEFCKKISNRTSSSYHARFQVQWFQENHSNRIGRWQENLSPEEVEIIEELLQPLLAKLGYIENQEAKEYSLSKKNKQKRLSRLVVVLGMHRGGTSAVTRGLQVMGVDLGHNFIPPQEDNVTGFWEDMDFNALNIELLKSINSDWSCLVPIQPADIQSLYKNGYFQRAINLIHAKTSETGIFGFKDPRVAKLLPFWMEVFKAAQLDVSYVIAIRHPLSVCQSLRKRDGIDFETCSLLWLEYVIDSLAGTAAEKRVLVDYDHLVQSPQKTLEGIAKALQLQIDTLELAKFKNEFLNQELRHTVYQVDDLLQYSSILPLVQEVYSGLLDVVEDKIELSDATLQVKIGQWKNELSRLRPILTLADRQSSTIRAMTVQNLQLNDKLAAKDRELDLIYRSRSWKLASSLMPVMRIFKRMHSFFFPRNSV